MPNNERIYNLHKHAIEEILREGYYVERFWNIVVPLYPETKVQDETDLDKICSLWNTFWFSLPDSRVIHGYIFNLVCELAEGSYLNDGELDAHC